MNEKLKCVLIYSAPLDVSAHGCRMSHDTHNKSNNECSSCGCIVYRDKLENNRCPNCDSYVSEGGILISNSNRDLIKKIGVKFKHESILEYLNVVYDVEMSTKTLLALSRHRVGISLTVRSTRYTTKKRRGKHEVQKTQKTQKYLDRIMDIVDEAINDKLSSDEISLLLPQAYIYRGQLQFNVRSLINFCKLRLKKDAHFQIRELAEDLILNLPSSYLYLFEDLVNECGSEEFINKFKRL